MGRFQLTNNRLKVCVCGGGSLAHALVGVLGSVGAEVRVLTRQAARWGGEIRVLYGEELEVRGRPSRVSGDAAEAADGADLIIIAVPAFAHGEVLRQIRPHLQEGAWVGAFPGWGGFNWQARAVLGGDATIFGVHRTPYICRTLSYGDAVSVSGVSPHLRLAALPGGAAEQIAAALENLLNIPTLTLDNYTAVTLTPSNSVVHPARLYSLFKDWTDGVVYQREVMFYEEWDDLASEVLLACDREIQAVCARLKVEQVTPVPAHYGVSDAEGLTRRIRGIRPLKDIRAPLSRTATGFVPDFNHRYFREDIPYGLVVIRSLAEVADVRTPAIDSLIEWGQGVLGVQYLTGNKLRGPDAADLPLPRHFGLNTVADINSSSV